MKIALVMIVKATDGEADVLKRCLASAAPHVDKVFLTITGDNEQCEKVGRAYNAHITHFDWVNDFAKARNFALEQVPDDYDYWMWLDADDVLVGGEKIRDILTDNPAVDALIFNYLYAFDEWKNPIVTHAKTRVLRHDGCVEWRGALHEDFHNTRQIDARFVEGVFVAHETDPERMEDSKKRNLLVASKDMEANPEDPRSYWNLGNAKKAAGDNDGALAAMETFLQMSKSEDEQYIIHMRMSEIYIATERLQDALSHARMAIAIKPTFPDAFILSAHILLALKRYQDARDAVMMGLQLEPQPQKMIVYNPRDYDLEPLRLLAKIYMQMSMPQLALKALESCLQIVPKDKDLQNIVKLLKKEAEQVEKVLELVEKFKEFDDEELQNALDSVDPEYRSHPALCHLRNTRLIKTESSGKDVVFCCGYTNDVWTPETAKKSGIGGSEEAVIHLSRHFADAGYNVTVYNNCGHKAQVFDGVTYRPYWEWNYRDKQDIAILWRTPKLLDYKPNADKVFLDMHDVIPASEFNKKRVEQVDKVFFKSNVHRELYPQIPDDKCVIVQNGIVWDQFQDNIERDPYLLVNTSSPDRSLHTLIRAFKRIKEAVPQAKLQWAYGWNVWDSTHGDDATMVQWKSEIEHLFDETDGAEALGRIGHDDVARLYQKAHIFAYPTAFFEIDCISARKAQASGAVPIVTDFAALDETVQYGVKVKIDVTKENWGNDGAHDFSLKDKRAIDEWVDAVIKELNSPTEDVTEMRAWTKQFDWSNIAHRWLKEM